MHFINTYDFTSFDFKSFRFFFFISKQAKVYFYFLFCWLNAMSKAFTENIKVLCRVVLILLAGGQNWYYSDSDKNGKFWQRWDPYTLEPNRKNNFKLGRVKRICGFEHSIMTNFNCACPAIQRGQGSGFLSEGSSWRTACMSEQRRFWRDCADALA